MVSDDELIDQLRRQVEQNGLNAFARSMSISPSSVSMILSNQRRMSQIIARALGYQLSGRIWEKIEEKSNG